eukprot:COSAG05_NODE_17016_length_333_cov_1.192308_1_plen_50_part_10
MTPIVLTTEAEIFGYLGKRFEAGGPSDEQLRVHARAVGVAVDNPFNKHRV